jgi:hypothetical protein
VNTEAPEQQGGCVRLAKHGDINKLVLMSGHDSVDTMWRRYHKGIPKAEAEKFWQVMPPASEERKIIHLGAI